MENVQNAMQEIEKQKTNSTKSIVALDPSDAVDSKQINEDFICIICMSVVSNPVHCSKCQALICQPCVRSWLSKAVKKTCPRGCGDIFREQPINRLIKNQLDAIMFQCPQDQGGCGKNFAYSDAQKHSKCRSLAGVACPQKCGEKTLYKDEGDIISHLLNNCLKQPGKC